MADGLRSGGEVGDVMEKTALKQFDNALIGEKNDSVNGMKCDKVNTFYESSASDKLFNKLCANGSKHEGILPCEDDCRKKRCVDRYDSSESSDSGVAVLSCTDCSGSSTASSDITDPGSPFSTTSSHSEDSGSQPAKMPPTQTAHHPPWPWTSEDGPPCKRSLPEKPVYSKRLKANEEAKKKQTLLSLKNSTVKTDQNFTKIISSVPSPNDKLVNHNNNKIKKTETTPKMQQGKITEYFRSQGKSNGIKKELFNLSKQNDSLVKAVTSDKILVDQQTQYNTIVKKVDKALVEQQIKYDMLKARLAAARKEKTEKVPIPKYPPSWKKKKVNSVTQHRKILPAPFMPDRITIDEQLNNIANFQSAMTLTPLSFPSNYTYMHTRGPKPPEPTNAILVPQFATLTNNKVPIPVLKPCLNVIQPVQKIATINNFNCVKLNTTVVPIVKVNALPSRLNGSSNVTNVSIPNVPSSPANISGVIATPSIPSIALSVETAVPTVLAAKPKITENCVASDVPISNFTPPKQLFTSNSTKTVQNVHIQCRMDDDSRTEEPHRTEECTKDEEEVYPTDETSSRLEEKSPTPTTDSDSGLSSNRECLEVCVSEATVIIEQQKSPILSQPKTIRFPAKQGPKEEVKSPQQSNDGRCRWAECGSRFDTSGALLEHLQVKHVISQSTQEHYVCLWLGCKVHGRTSCSRSWLERHVLAHAGTKPFRCIVDGCGQRFNSQLMLERHVNGHFNTDGSPNNSAKKTTSDNNVVKLFKRNGKKIRFRRQPWSARMFDFIDSGIMEGLQHNLLLLTQKRTLGKISAPGDTIHLQSQILARRIETDGSVKYLLKWHPPDVIPDEWVAESEYKSTKFVSIPSLNSSSRTALSPALFSISSEENQHNNRRAKHRRKPVAVVKRT